MAYTTRNGITTAVATAYHESAANGSASKLDLVLRRAEREVARLAPDPVGDAEYTGRAKDAELVVFEMLYEMPDYLKSESFAGVSVALKDRNAIAEAIYEIMASYYKGETLTQVPADSPTVYFGAVSW